MRAVLSFKTHSGWAVLIALGVNGKDLHILERSRVELVKSEDAVWAKQPYHSAEELEPKAARDLVKRGIAGARECAKREVRAASKRLHAAGHDIIGCAVLVGDPMPDWSVAEILSVHFRMHKAEGFLYQDVLVRAAEACQIPLAKVPLKQLNAKSAFDSKTKAVVQWISTLGKSVGPPWGKDQKEATLAATIALQELNLKSHLQNSELVW
ncbi:MAG TPA: hypothetical protein VGN86_16685 [Pyrinomonadaceae bacterium]|jgi:hypothetical protein|nr:hypothetical protein [Pyrinomonadaceae bacterium]